jgi:hypothetical protein
LITVKQHVPRYIDLDGHKDTVETLQDLLDLSWVAYWKRGDAEEPFHRFSQTPEGYLMAEFNEGRRWRVVAKFKSDTPLDLPIWEQPAVHDYGDRLK